MEHGREPVKDIFARIECVDIAVVEEEAVKPESGIRGPEFIDHECLPGRGGDIHPVLLGPVFVGGEGDSCKAFVIGAIVLDGT